MCPSTAKGQSITNTEQREGKIENTELCLGLSVLHSNEWSLSPRCHLRMWLENSVYVPSEEHLCYNHIPVISIILFKSPSPTLTLPL